MFVYFLVLLFYLEWHLVFLQTLSFFKEKQQFQNKLEKKDILKLILSPMNYLDYDISIC